MLPAYTVQDYMKVVKVAGLMQKCGAGAANLKGKLFLNISLLFCFAAFIAPGYSPKKIGINTNGR
jgi:hypothetical protein